MKQRFVLFFILSLLLASCSPSPPTTCYVRIGDENVVQEMKVGRTDTIKAMNLEEKKQYAHKMMLVSVMADSCEFTVDDESLVVRKNTTETRYDVKIKVVGVD